MKKIIFFIALTCLTAVFISGCSLPEQFFGIESSVSDYIGEKLNSNNNDTDIGEANSSSDSESFNADIAEKSEETGNVPLSESETDSQTESEDSFSSEDDQTEESLDIQTTEGYVLSSDGYTMYVDLENTGSRRYPGEGEDRKVAFDISNAEQIQTNVSEFNPARANLIRSGIQVTIEYYVKDGVNIATKLTSDGDEKEPYAGTDFS